MRLTLGLLAAVSCGKAPAPERPDDNAGDPPEVAACSTAEADALARYGVAIPEDPIDLDGDGQADPVYRDDCPDSCSFALYLAPTRDCARFVGEVVGVGTPQCVSEGRAGEPCPISILQAMRRGEAQEAFYDFVDGAYRFAGADER